eukprot:6203074-Pleurochrysis_carterae.AAC.2
MPCMRIRLSRPAVTTWFSRARALVLLALARVASARRAPAAQDKLEDLKECALALSEPELVKAEFDWDAAVRDVATLIAL